MNLITPLRLALMAVCCIVFAAVIAFGEEAHAAASPCEDMAALQQRLDAFDERWNASDAWGLTAQFAVDGSASAQTDTGRQAVYRELVERLGRTLAPRQTRLLRVRAVGSACLVDVRVHSGERSEPGLFLLAPQREGGIVAMR